MDLRWTSDKSKLDKEKNWWSEKDDDENIAILTEHQWLKTRWKKNKAF